MNIDKFIENVPLPISQYWETLKSKYGCSKIYSFTNDMKIPPTLYLYVGTANEFINLSVIAGYQSHIFEIKYYLEHKYDELYNEKEMLKILRLKAFL